MCARPPVRAQGLDHRHGQRTRRSRVGPAVERTNSRTPFFSGGTDSTSRQRGAAGSARGWPGRTHGSPRRPQRQRHGRGRAAPRKLLVRRGERSLRSGRCFRRKPQRLTSLSTPTFPPPGHKERGRPTGRARGLIRGSQRPGVITVAEGGAARPLLVRRAGPSLRDASCFHRTPQHPTSLSTPTFPPPASSEHARPTGRACGLIRGSQRPGGVRPSKGNNAAPGVFQAGNQLFFLPRGTLSGFFRRRHPSAGRRHVAGVSIRRRGLLSHPSRTSRKIRGYDLHGGGFRLFHPGRTTRLGSSPSAAASIHPMDDDTAPGFPSGGAVRFFPISARAKLEESRERSWTAASVLPVPAGRCGPDRRRPPDQSWARRRPSHPPDDDTAPGFRPAARSASFPSRTDDAARIVAVRRINPGRGDVRPNRDDAAAPASRTTGAARVLPPPSLGGTINRRRDNDNASSVSLFFCMSLCLRSGMSIAGNNVPPVPNDIGSMGGTNSNNRDPTPALPRGRVNVRPHPPRRGTLSRDGGRGDDSNAWRSRRTDVVLAGPAIVVPKGMCYVWKNIGNGRKGDRVPTISRRYQLSHEVRPLIAVGPFCCPGGMQESRIGSPGGRAKRICPAVRDSGEILIYESFSVGRAGQVLRR